MEMNSNGGANVCKCPHHKMIPGLIVLFGIWYLLYAVGTISLMMRDVGFGVVVIIAGITKMFSYKCTCCNRG